VEIMPKVTLRRKLLGEIPVCQLASISECDSTIQESLIDMQSGDEACAVSYTGMITFLD